MLTKQRKQQLEANIWKFYLYRVMSSLIFTTPIFILFLLANRLSMTQVMILQSFYLAVTMLGVIPAGIIADYIGKKKVLIANELFFTVGWAVYAVSNSFWTFLIAEALIALSAAMWESTGAAFFYETLKELGREHDFKRLYGNVTTINYIFWGLSAFAGAYIATHGFRLAYWSTALSTAIATFVILSFTETKCYEHADRSYLAHLKDASLFAVKHPRVRFLIVYTAIIAAIAFSMFHLIQPYLQLIGIPLAYFGIVYLLTNFVAAFGSKSAHRIEGHIGENTALLLFPIVMLLGYLGMSRFFPVAGASIPVIMAFTSGMSDPLLADYLHKRIESHNRATVLALNRFAVNLLSAVAAPFFGWIVDAWSLRAAFLIASTVMLVGIAILVFVLLPGRKMEKV